MSFASHPDSSQWATLPEAARLPQGDRFQALVEATAQIVWSADKTGAVSEPSPSWQVFTGQTTEEWLGWGWLKSIHPDDQTNACTAWNAALTSGMFYQCEYRLWHAPSSTYRWMLARGTPLVDADPQAGVQGWVGMSTDITDRKNAEQVLRESRDQFRHMADSAPAMLWITDVNGYCTFLSRSWYIFTGQTEEEGHGLGWTLAVHPEEREHAGATFIDASTRRVNYVIDFRLRRADGEYRWVVDAGHPRFDDQGEFLGFIGSVFDITERKVAEKALRERERQLQIAISATGLGFWSFDPASGSAHFSPAAQAMLGFPADTADVMNRWREVMHPDYQDAAKAVFERSLDPLERGDGRMEYMSVRPGCETRWIEAVWQVEFRGEGPEARAVRATGTMLDITERKRAQTALEEQAAALRDADRRKDEFLAMLAHELRNPLASVSHAVALLDDPLDSAGSDWAIDVIARQTAQLSRLVDDLLDVSRITRGKISLRKETVDAAAILDRAREAVSRVISERRHRLEIDYTSGLMLDADPTRLEQILVNLLGNSAKYTPPGGHIVLAAHRSGDQIVMSVRDDGMGIPRARIEDMFELFAQGERTEARVEGGLGIGLTVVRALCELHGGSVTASSPGPGLGSTFTVSLPCSPAATPIIQAPPVAIGSAKPTLAKTTLAKRVLVVDDNVDTAVGLSRLLGRRGFVVETVYDGSTALERARRFEPSVVLLDIGLPGMDGYDVARALRADPVCASAMIVAISGYGQEDDRRRSREAGFDHHLVKPAPFEELHALLSAEKPVNGSR